MSEAPQGKNLRPELRIFIASALSIIVILLWAKFFAPKPPAQTQQAKTPAATSTTTPGTQAPSGNTASAPATVVAAPRAVVLGDRNERTIVVENDLYRIEFSNRGGVVKSWKLKKYLDDAKPRQVLDVVHADTSNEFGGWPFALTLDDPSLETAANSALYVSSTNGSVKSPADIAFSWSDGHLEVTKKFHFDDSYTAKAEVSAKYDGKPLTAGLSWLGGFGDVTVTNPRPVETVSVVYTEGGKLTALPYKKVDDWDKVARGVWWGGKDWTGIEDRYFAAVFMADVNAAPGRLETRYWKVWHPVKIDGKDVPEPVEQIAAATAVPTSLRIYVGPKDYDVLKRMSPPLHSLVNFGWLEFVSDPLFHGMKWLQKYIPNWGWAIVVMTLIINMLLFPLRISSYKTTLKMQRVAPEIKAIQERYKKYSMRDPRKAEMNKEVMAVYSREGINPVGGCFQMLVQMPIWIGLNTALRNAIELRHAPWFSWITDLSAKDPYYILPVIMAVSMYLATKMTPMTTTDPQQQAMMKFMPITFAGMFIIFPISSGLAVYILTSSLVGIVQQWYLNRAHPITPTNKPIKSKK